MSNVQRLNVNDPADLRLLLENGMIWKGGPRTIQLAIDALVEGTIAPSRDILAAMPPEVASHVDEERNIAGQPPLAEALRLREDDGA